MLAKLEDNTVENDTDTPFTIPESAFGPIRDLVDMDSKDFEAFVLGLTNAKPSISPAALGRHIASEASGLSRSVVNSIVDEIVTLEYLKQDSELSAAKFASSLTAAALEASSEDFSFTDEDAKILEQRLTAIFSADHVLELNTKSASILTDHDRLFLSAKILTDARPVFNEDGSKIEAFAIVHMLRLHVAHNQNHEDIFVALDVGDIPKLRNVLDRADQKAEAIQAMLKSTETPYLDIDDSDNRH